MLQTNFDNGQAHQSQRFIQSVLDALSAHISILDETGVIVTVNKAWRQFADINGMKDPNYSIGVNYLQICENSSGHNNKEASLVAQGIREVMQGKSHDFVLEYPCHSPSKHRWFVLHITKFEWDKKPHYIVAHQNVTDFKRIQIELAESKQRIQAIVDGVSNGILTLNNRGIVESANPAAEEIFGYEPNELSGIPLNKFFPNGEKLAEPRQLLKQLTATTDHELNGRRKDGSVFPMYISLDRLHIGRKRIFTAIIQDMTERKRMQAEILENEKLNLALEKERELRDLKNRFIAMMSHEIRTPLASIQLSSDLLKVYGQKVPPDERELYFENITTQIELLTELVRDVQTVNTGDSVSTTMMLESTDLVEYSRAIVQEFQLVHTNTHNIIFDTKHAYMDTRLDRKIMRRVITNLITNAVKYSPEGGDVIIKISSDGRNACVSVTDQGIGIPKDDLEQLFTPFHRASNVDTFPGTGLGLTIAKQAVELHQGSIDVESKEGIGTTITIHLPIYIENNEE